MRPFARLGTATARRLSAAGLGALYLSIGALSCDVLGSEPLTVVEWSPLEGRISDTANTPVFVTFSAPVDKTSTELAFSLSADNAQVPGRITWNGDSRLEFKPWHELDIETDYTLKVGTQAEDLEGNSLAQDFIVEFSTRTISQRPRLVSFTPADGSRTVSRYPDVVVTFDRAMDPASVMAKLSVSPSYKGRLSWNEALTAYTLSAVDALEWQTEYTVTVPADTLSTNGFEIGAAASWRFTTGTDSDKPSVASCDNGVAGPGALSLALDDPEDGSMLVNTGWEKDYPLRIVFSEAMDKAAAEGSLSIAPEASWDPAWNDEGTELTLAFKEPLSYLTTYSLRLNEAAKDLQGNPVARPITWRFRVDGPRSTPPRLDKLELIVPSYAIPAGVTQTIFDRTLGAPYTYSIPFVYRAAENEVITDTSVLFVFTFLVSNGASIDPMSFAENVTILPSGNALTAVPESVSVAPAGDSCSVTLSAKIADKATNADTVKISVYKGLEDDFGNVMGSDWVFDVLDLD